MLSAIKFELDMDVSFSKEFPTVRKLFGALTVIHSVISVVACKILHINWQAFAVQFSECCISSAEPTEQLASECHHFITIVSKT